MKSGIFRLASLLILAILAGAGAHADPDGAMKGMKVITDDDLKNPSKPKERLAYVVRRTPKIEKEFIEIVSPRCKTSIGKSPNSACYITVHNKHDVPIVIESIVVYPSPEHTYAPVANQIEIRTFVKDVDGKSKHVTIGKISIPAGEKFVQKPGGNHVLLKDLRQALVEGKALYAEMRVKYLEEPIGIELPISSK